MMILVGYFVIYTYILLMTFVVGEFIRKKSNVEMSRKVIHISLFMVWFFIDIFFKNTIHQIIISSSFLVANIISYKFKLFKSIEREDSNHFGTIYFALALLIIYTVAFFFEDLYIHTGPAVMCLTFGDGAASVFGHLVKSKRITKDKSLSGFISCAIGSLIGMLFLKCTAFNEFDLVSVILLSVICAIVELVGKGLDNFSIVFTVFLLSYLLYIENTIIIQIVLICFILLIVAIYILKYYRNNVVNYERRNKKA